MKLNTSLLAIIAAGNVNAAIVAQYNSFTTASGATVSTDASAQTDWTTTVLTDNATGTGALGQGNQAGANRQTDDFGGGAGQAIGFSNNREGDSGTPTGSIGESTWLTFTVTAAGGKQLDFSGQTATADTYATTSIGGASADWTLYYSLDSGTTWISLGTQTGASSTSGDSTATGVSWNLGAVGTQTSVDFLIDPVSTSATNGNYNQRGVAMGNFALNATAVPEPSSAALLGLGGLALVFRRRK